MPRAPTGSTAATRFGEAQRGRRRVHRDVDQRGHRRRRARRGWRARPTTRASSPRSTPTPTRTRARCSRSQTRSSSRSTRSRIRATSGRSAVPPRRPASAGVVICERRAGGRHRRRLQGLGRRGRASAGRAGPQPDRLDRDAKRAGAWVYGADGEARDSYRTLDYRGGSYSCSAEREAAFAPGSPAPATSWSRSRPRPGRLPERLGRRGRAPVRGLGVPVLKRV